MKARFPGSKAKPSDGSDLRPCGKNNVRDTFLPDRALSFFPRMINSMTIQPTQLSRSDSGAIVIRWDDQTETVWTPFQLRTACPCATCREKKRAAETAPVKPKTLPVISAAEAKPLRIEAMRPVGNYAYNIAFSDGHDSGLFTLAMLHEGFKADAS